MHRLIRIFAWHIYHFAGFVMRQLMISWFSALHLVTGGWRRSLIVALHGHLSYLLTFWCPSRSNLCKTWQNFQQTIGLACRGSFVVRCQKSPPPWSVNVPNIVSEQQLSKIIYTFISYLTDCCRNVNICYWSGFSSTVMILSFRTGWSRQTVLIQIRLPLHLHLLDALVCHKTILFNF